MTAERRLRAPALGAGAALTAMLFASRLPATLDFILPRRAGWSAFEAAFTVLSRPGATAVFSAAVSLGLLAALGRFTWLAASAARGRAWSAKDFLARGFALALVVLLLRWSFVLWLEVAQKVWFPFGSMNLLEPFANAAVITAIVFTAMRAALGFLAPKSRPIPASLKSWCLINAAATLLAVTAYGAWRPAPAAPVARRTYVVLTEDGGKPDQIAYDLPLASASPAAGVRRLESLRAAYEERAKLMDVDGLRSVLALGVRSGDDLARSVLLEHLTSAPPSPAALGALGALADESVHRVGPFGASRIAVAYARLGDAPLAALWAKKAAAGPRGIPEGLLDLSGGALKPGRIAGRVEGLKPLRVALYRKSDPAAPYLLDAGALVAAAEPDAKGRFSFSGLAAGRYYLAFAFAPLDAAIRVSGQRGDLLLGGRAPSLELPALTFRRVP